MTQEEINALAARLKEAKEAYYNGSESLMADAEFDELEELLRQEDPHNAYFSLVGSPVEAAGSKIQHAVPMLSANKAKTMEEADKWLKKLALPEGEAFILEPKIDGLSAACRYQNGQLQYIATRGDGRTGQDVSHIADYMAGIPKMLPQPISIEVRGELYLPRDTEFDTQGKPLRNNCVGLVNRKEDRGDLRYVHFAAYSVVGFPYETEAEAVAFIKTLGFETVDVYVTNERDGIEAYRQKYLEELRDLWPFETDGLMIIVNRRIWHDKLDSRWVVDRYHHYAIAFKPPAAAKETKLLAVEWQPSRQASLVPVAVFEPIKLGGAILERATLHNAQFVKTLLLEPGDSLLVERANDVIPYVKDNISRHGRAAQSHIDSFLALRCPSCQTKTVWSGAHLKCPNGACPEVRIQQILYWVKRADMENIAEGAVRKLYESGKARRIADLYQLTKQDFSGMDGFADKKIDNFFKEIAKSRTMGARQFIARLGIPLVQEKALKKLGIASLVDFWNFCDITYVIGQNLIAWREEEHNAQLVRELAAALNIVDQSPEAQLPQVCLTGKGPATRAELEEELRSRGYEPVSTVTKETALLLCDDLEGSSSKLQKARQLGIPIQSYTDFFKA